MRNRLAAWDVFAFAAVVIALFVYLWQSQIAAPTTPAGTGFDQAQAFATLSRLIKEERPHPAGSALNAVVRDRILAEFGARGYAAQYQAAFQCSPADRYPGCTAIENIIAVHKGTSGKAVLMTAHYDSVPAGPGVGDDGAGVAVLLEIAGAMAQRQTKNDIIFLVTDGEESGLHGAEAFAQRDPLFKTVALVVNVEARGASGPSMMFETGPGNAKLIDLYAREVAHPATNSLLYEVYKLLPNDTDFSVYRKLGLTGFNFAFSNSASLYHSQNDNLQNLDRNTLQHHGDNTFAIVKAVADIDLETLKSAEDASYFDAFGQAFHVWPASINTPVAIIALLAILGLVVMHRAAFSLSAIGWSLLGVVAVPALLFGIGWLLSWPLGIWPGVHPLDHPAPWAHRVALAAVLILAPLVMAFAARTEARAVFLVNWLVLSGVALALAMLITGASFTLVWPVMIVAVVGWIETFARKGASLTITAAVGFVAVAFFYAAYLLALELVLGFDLSHYKLLAVFPIALALVPLFASSIAGNARGALEPLGVLLFVIVVTAVMAARAPAYAPNHPRGLNLVYLDDGAAPRWLAGFVGAPDGAFLKATGFPAKDEPYLQLGLLKAEGRLRPAEKLDLPAPTFVLTETRVEGDLTTLRGTLHAARTGNLIGIALPPVSGIRALRADGQNVLGPTHVNAKDPVVARFVGLADHALPVEITFETKAKPVVTLFERSALPECAECSALTKARPTDAAPVHSGDGAVVYRKVDLSALQPPAPGAN